MKTIRVFAWIFIATAGASFAMPIVCISMNWLAGPCQSESIELPIDPTFVGVDALHRVLIYSSHYERMEIFDSEGRFIRGWFMKSGGRLGRFDSSGSVITVIYSTDDEIDFDLYGKVIKKVHRKGSYLENVNRSPGIISCADEVDCSRYRLRHRLFWASVAVVEPDSQERVLLKEPLPIVLIRIPSPAVLWALMGITLLGVHRSIARRRTTKAVNQSEKREQGT